MQHSVDSGRETLSSRSGPLRATARPRNLVSNNTCSNNSPATVVPSATLSHNHPHLSRHFRQNSLDSQKQTYSCSSSSSRNGTTLSSPILSHHQPHQQQRIIKSASTSNLAGCASSTCSASSVSKNTSQCLRDICAPLNAARLKPIRNDTCNCIVSKCVMPRWTCVFICYIHC